MIQQNTPPPTRTSQTEHAYLARAERLRKQAAKEARTTDEFAVAETINWFCRQTARWSPATQRQYQASLRFTVECEFAWGVLALDEAIVLLDRLGQPLCPKSKKSLPQTSARKHKHVPLLEFQMVVTRLDAGDELDRLAGQFLDCNIRLGLRPVEWQSVILVGSSLVVRCAKFTNNRGVGEFRALDLDPVIDERPDFVQDVDRLAVNLSDAAVAAGGWPTLWSRLASRIARACRALSMKRIALYTTRHIAIATAKQLLVPAAVAALAGHASDRTAGTHYARSRTGFAAHITCARPAIELLDHVRQPPRAARQADGRFRREIVQPRIDNALAFEAETADFSFPCR